MFNKKQQVHNRWKEMFNHLKVKAQKYNYNLVNRNMPGTFFSPETEIRIVHKYTRVTWGFKTLEWLDIYFVKFVNHLKTELEKELKNSYGENWKEKVEEYKEAYDKEAYDKEALIKDYLEIK